MRSTSVATAIMSHLSDAQHLMKAGMVQDANTHINFVKLLTLIFDEMNIWVANSTLDEIWEEAKTFR